MPATCSCPDEGLVLRQFALGSLWADESAGFILS
jgi:hypothetical protein